jgi:hypothetical protein
MHFCTLRIFIASFGLMLVSVISPDYPSAMAQSASIDQLSIYDKGNAGTTPSFDASIDTIRDTCDPSGAATPEQFNDTIVGITFTNDANATLRLSSLTYELPRVKGSKRFRSPPLAFIGSVVVRPGNSATVYSPIFSAGDGQKKLPGSKLLVSSLSGFRTITFKIRGSIGNQPIALTASTTLSFGNIDRCS